MCVQSRRRAAASHCVRTGAKPTDDAIYARELIKASQIDVEAPTEQTHDVASASETPHLPDCRVDSSGKAS